jgi:cold-inducible RNA-binding protein
MRMTISGLPRHFDKFDLQRLFNPFGWVDYSKIIIDPISGMSKGKGIVEMSRDDEAKKAMATLQGKVLGTNPLNIKEAKAGGPRFGDSRPGDSRPGDPRPGDPRPGGGY